MSKANAGSRPATEQRGTPRWVSGACGRAVILRRAQNAVTVTRAGVAGFAANWPCAHFPDKPVTFVFASNGDLVDMLPYAWDRDADGSAVCAMADDCKDILAQSAQASK